MKMELVRQKPSQVDKRAVRNLLARMATALTAGDGGAVAAVWETPALIVGGDQVVSLASAGDLETYFGRARARYNSRGIMDTRPEILRFEEVTERTRLVEVRWPYLDGNGEERGEELATYLIRLTEEGEYKLRAAVLRGASSLSV